MADTTKIMFKRGLQEHLPATGVDGVFYLTTDTNRLYVGKGTGAPALLNQTVKFIETATNWPSAAAENDFVYCTAENILAVYVNGVWKQINPDHNDNFSYKVTSGTVSDGEVSAQNKTVSYKISLEQKQYNLATNTTTNEIVSPIDLNLVIDADDLAQILPTAAKVSVVAEKSGSAAVIKTSGDGSSTSSQVTLSAAENSNVSLDVSNNTIAISAIDTRYSLAPKTNASGKSVIRLQSSGGSNTSEDVIFEAGTDLLVNTNSTSGITYSHNATTRSDSAGEKTNLSETTPVNVVTGVTSNAQGHITGVVTTPIQLPENQNIITGIEQTEDWQAILKKSGTGIDDLKIDFTEEASQLQADLEEYISTKLAETNTALTYKGTISDYAALLNKTSVEIGDVYLLSQDSIYNDKLYKTGDMFIATCDSSTDHEGGVIAPDEVEWTYIPSGDELNTDTLFYGKITTGTNSITYGLEATRGGDDDAVPTLPADNKNLTITAGTDLTLSATTNGSATIKHKVYSAPSTTTTNASSVSEFTAITGVTVNNGHVTALSAQKFTPIPYSLTTSSNKIKLINNTTKTDIATIPVSGDTWISTTLTNGSFAIAHNAPSTVKSNVTASNTVKALSAGGTLNIISNIQYDEKGHVVSASADSLTLPADQDTTYDLFLGSSSSSAAKVTVATKNPWLIFRNEDSKVNEFTARLNSDANTSPIVIETNASGNMINFSLEWGTFEATT